MAADGSSVDFFLKVDGIDGESQDKSHSKEIELRSASVGVSQMGSAHTGGGAGSGVSDHGDYEFTKFSDQSLPKLFQACSSGEHIKKAVVTFRKAGKDQQDYMKVTLSDVLVSSFEFRSPRGGSQLPMDHFNLNYGKIENEYKEQKSDGTLGGSVKAGWDIKSRKKV